MCCWSQVKAQYGMLLESIKQVSFHSLQEELESHLDTLRGQVKAHHTQAYAVHKVDMEASVMDVGRPLLACGSCGPDEYCSYRQGRPQCERCTICPPGFFLVSQCSNQADRICQVRVEYYYSEVSYWWNTTLVLECGLAVIYNITILNTYDPHGDPGSFPGSRYSVLWSLFTVSLSHSSYFK